MQALRFRSARFLAVILFPLAFIVTACGGGGGDGGGNQYLSISTALARGDLDLDGLDDIAEGNNRYKLNSTGTGWEPTHNRYLATIALQNSLEPGSFLVHDVLDDGGKIDLLGGYISSISIGDLNDDALPDLVLAAGASVNVFFQSGAESAQFLPHVDIQTESDPVDAVIGDLDGDGSNDIAVAGSPITMLFNDSISPGTQFAASVFLLNASSVAIGDLDGDGRNDIAATGRDTDDNNVYIILQKPVPNSPGQFSLSAAYVVGYKPVAVCLSDLNGDTLPDIAVVNRGGNVGGVSILLQESSSPGIFVVQSQYAVERNSDAIDVGDLNGDSLPDLVISSLSASKVSIFFQDASQPGYFTAPQTMLTKERNITDVVIGEFTGDTKADIAVSAEGGVYLHAQDANNPGTFLAGVSL